MKRGPNVARWVEWGTKTMRMAKRMAGLVYLREALGVGWVGTGIEGEDRPAII